jgi:hypothetical protein
MENNIVNELLKDRPATNENWPEVIGECLQLMAKAAEEIQRISKLAINPDKCQLLAIPYGTNDAVNIAFEGSTDQIREFVRRYEQNPEASKRCVFIVIKGNVIPITQWAPIEQLAYEPETKLNS